MDLRHVDPMVGALARHIQGTTSRGHLQVGTRSWTRANNLNAVSEDQDHKSRAASTRIRRRILKWAAEALPESFPRHLVEAGTLALCLPETTNHLLDDNRAMVDMVYAMPRDQLDELAELLGQNYLRPLRPVYTELKAEINQANQSMAHEDSGAGTSGGAAVDQASQEGRQTDGSGGEASDGSSGNTTVVVEHTAMASLVHDAGDSGPTLVQPYLLTARQQINDFLTATTSRVPFRPEDVPSTWALFPSHESYPAEETQSIWTANAIAMRESTIDCVDSQEDQQTALQLTTNTELAAIQDLSESLGLTDSGLVSIMLSLEALHL